MKTRAGSYGVLFAALAAACGSSSATSGGGPSADAGEGTSLDGGVDASHEDASEASTAADGGAGRDGASTADAAAPTTALACSEAIADVYAAPAGLPPLTDATRGAIVRCAVDSSIDASAVASRLQAANVANVAVTSGAVTYRVLYRTRRGSGADGVSAARVFLPTSPRSSKLPVLVAAHGTSGLAPACAVTKYESVSDYLVLPWVAHGYAVILPDYAGLGTGGVQGYLDNVDTGYSTLDAARALRAFVAPGALSDDVVVFGHSQGGGAALSAQALAGSYGAGGVLRAVIGFAAGWSYDVSVDGFRNPSVSTSLYGGGPAAFGSLFSYAYFANHVGVSHAGDGFGGGARANVDGAIESQCIVSLLSSIPQAAPTIGDLFDATFRSTAIACVDGTSGCADPGKSYVDYLKSNILRSDASGAATLVVQGLSDTTVMPSVEACIVKKIQADGLSPTVCADANAQHLDVVQRNAAFALAWTDAVVAGMPAPACPSSATLPACP